jgi:hypothetical protein
MFTPQTKKLLPKNKKPEKWFSVVLDSGSNFLVWGANV